MPDFSISPTSHRTISLIGLLFVLALAGCARSVPLISHAHLGHALTAWHDTPQDAGLFVVAEREIANAQQEIALARVAQVTPVLAKVHVKNVIHSLNPDFQSNGTGLGYGAIRAMQGSIDHIGFAASSQDASQNLRQSTVVFESHAKEALDQLINTAQVARSVIAADDEAFQSELESLAQALEQCAIGKDLDNDGFVGNQPGESGLRQLRMKLSTMLANEVSPPYHPAGRRYLFGLVKLPDGRWAYRFDNTARGTEGGGEGSAEGGDSGGY